MDGVPLSDHATSGSLGAHLSVKDGLYLDLPCEVELLGGRFGAFVPLLEDLSKSRSIDFDESLQDRSMSDNNVTRLFASHLELSQVPF